jgi:hypothetical protein
VVGRVGSPSTQDELAGGRTVALGFSLFVTAVYHLGYPEFRGAAVIEPMIGNGLITLGYLATRHPITPVTAHIAMHIAAVLHGLDTTVRLPSHS